MMKLHIRTIKKKISDSKGLTFIEILIAISILAIISTITIASFFSLLSQTALNGNARNIVSILNLARSKTVSSENFSVWGVHFSTDSYAIFNGSTYDSGSSTTTIYSLPSSLEISSIAINGGGADVLFNKITGQTAYFGNITLRNKSQPSDLINISVESSGQSNATTLDQPATNSRVSDSRHIHFIYNGNSQTATTLSLSFADFPADNISIPFQSYLSNINNSFEWEEIITINNIPRVMKIHSHTLDGSATLFCVHREQDTNEEQVSLALDGENLLNYTAGGQESQGTSAWVGAPERQ